MAAYFNDYGVIIYNNIKYMYWCEKFQKLRLHGTLVLQLGNLLLIL